MLRPKPPGEGANARPQLRAGGRLVGGKACREDVELRRGIPPARSVGEASEYLHGRPSRGGASWTGNGAHSCSLCGKPKRGGITPTTVRDYF
jgi:hypothetical protein